MKTEQITPAQTYWVTLATVSIRRLWSMRQSDDARIALRAWVRTLRQCRPQPLAPLP